MQLQLRNDRPRAQADIWIRDEARIFASIMLCACLGLSAKLLAQAPAAKTLPKDAPMTLHAAGAFDAKTTLLPPDDTAGGANIGRYTLDKQYHGDLEGTAKGEMLGAGDPAKGNA